MMGKNAKKLYKNAKKVKLFNIENLGQTQIFLNIWKSACKNLFSHDLYDSRSRNKIQWLSITVEQIPIHVKEEL